MRRTALIAVLLVVVSGCGSEPPKSPPAGVDGLVIPTPSPDPSDFVAVIDNPWFPLRTGSQWLYTSLSEDGEQTISVLVTGETRVVAGVTTTVVQDTVLDAKGRTVEETYDWYAQDRDGNVWYFGEDTTAYDEGGNPDKSGSWEAGVNGAQAGIVMLAVPRVGDGYAQEHLPGVAEDRARILSLTASAKVPWGTYDDLLQTEDTTPLEPELVERKYYAHGVGVIKEEDVSGGDEVVELISFTTG